MNIHEETRSQELTDLCACVKELVSREDYEKCNSMICEAMVNYPHAPQPHNLLGVVLEMTGNHVSAMRHFRAAWALDPTYYPPCQNLNNYGTFYSNGLVAFDEGDCKRPLGESWRIEPKGKKTLQPVRRK